ncbi:MAG: hypothetical protein R3229_09535 [Alphaproteobacteria bacterium]|nr:hypothetical protein [Alphaproteobacteria bacterium]
MRSKALALTALGVLAVSACVYRPGDEDNPIARSFSWFSYLNADDIRAACRPATPDRFRIVYNGVWQEQIRNYDFTMSAGAGELKAQVRGETDFARPIPLTDLLAPWRAKTVRKRVGRRDMEGLRRALRRSGFYQPVPQGTRVQSWGFFWVVAACQDGRFHFNVWAHPSRRFDRVVLARFLGRLDGMGIPFATPRDTWEPDRQDEGKDIDRFQLVVRGAGFADNLTIF